MIWLLLSVLCSTAIFVAFKLFGRYNIDNLQAIVVNYLVAFALGATLSGGGAALVDIPRQPWAGSVLLLGFLFITMFQLMAWVSQKFGVAAVSVAVKMSVIIPIAFGIWYFSEPLGLQRGLGFAGALTAVFLATYKPGQLRGQWQMWVWPLLLFAGSGFIDAFINYNEATLLQPGQHDLFATSIFGMAGSLGLLFIAVRWLRRGGRYHWKAVVGGIGLGIPNYGSIYFILKALDTPLLESSVVFALNHVAIVALSTVLGVALFREDWGRANQWGLGLSLISIWLIYGAL
jgi:drug/metabolite transporter (DMT)-like permease